MQAKFTERSPAKINLFLKIINKREDGYHNLRSGITLINLFDNVTAENNDKFEVKYIGEFAPQNNNFDNCIVSKFFLKYKITKPKYRFIIKKNIPIQSGLGSASSNLAAVIRILNKLGYKDLKKNYSNIGADIPFFINNSDALVRGTGDILINQLFPKYFFLLIKPSINCSTKKMFKLINSKNIHFNSEQDISEITENDYGNDFEFYAKNKYDEINTLLTFLGDQQNVIFVRLTGSGSCVFAAFESKKEAENSQKIFNKCFPNIWSKVVENNFI